MKKIFLVFFWIGCAAMASAQNSGRELVESTVSVEKIKSHIYFLASDALRGRDTGSQELKIAAEYLKTQLMGYGIGMAPGMDSYLQPVKMLRQKQASGGHLRLKDVDLSLAKDLVIIKGGNGMLKGDFVYVNYGMEEDFKKANVEGKIAIAVCGDGESQQPFGWFGLTGGKRERAKAAGALALVELYTSRQMPWNVLKGYFSSGDRVMLADENEQSGEEELPHLWANYSSETLQKAVKAGKGEMEIEVDGMEKHYFDSYNVVGYLEGSDPELKDQVVMYSAHYDHVGVGRADATGDTIYNGARDNATGTVTVLSAAENLGKAPTARSALFVFFTGEEKGLLGSDWFARHPAIPLQSVVYCFNSDNAGYNDTSVATIIGLERTTAAAEIKKACEAFGLQATDDPAPEQGLFDRSDNVNFAKKGVPAPTFSLGFSAFDEEIGRYYHQPGDQADNLDYEYLEKFFKSYVYAARLIGNMAAKPFWVEGDKYYQAGQQLYSTGGK